MQYGFGYSQGTERYLTILQRGLRDRGHGTLILAGDPEQRGGKARMQLGAVRNADIGLRAYPTCGWMTIRGLSAQTLTPILRELQPDVVHVANPAHIGIGLIQAAVACHIPVVVTVMDYWWICPKSTLRLPDGKLCDAKVHWTQCLSCIAADRSNSTRETIARTPGLRSVALPALYFGSWLSRGVPASEITAWMNRGKILQDALERASAVIFPSRSALDLIGRQLSQPAKVSIPYGLEPHWFQHGLPRERQPGARRVVGFAGALEPHKGAHVLLEAIRKLDRNVRVRIAGAACDAAYEQRLRELAAGLDVDFVGRVQPSEMPAFMAGLDVLVVPSQWPENMPIVVLEAYASGLPVIASRVGGIAEIVPEDALFDFQEPQQLAERLRKWADEPAATPMLPSVSTAEEMVAQTFEVYSSITEPVDAPA